MARSKKGEQNQRQKFIASLAETASVTTACQAAGVPRRTAYNWRSADQTFAADWDDALESGTDALEDEAVKRAKAGSDTLMIFMLKARRPDKFKDRVATELTGRDGGPIETKDVSDLDRAKAMAFLATKAARASKP